MTAVIGPVGAVWGSPDRSDPAAPEVFRKAAPQFDRTFRELGE